MSAVGDTRRAIADALSTGLPDERWQVHAAPPMQPVPPCIHVRTGAGEPSTVAGGYTAEFDLVCLAGAADQPSNLEAVEAMAEHCVAAAHTAFRLLPGYIPGAWAAPGIATINGQPLLAAVVTVTIPLIDIEE